MKFSSKGAVAATNEPVAGPGDSIMHRWSNSYFLIVGSVVLFCFCLATRIPLRPSFLTGWDPVNFALAIHHFDITNHQPHPPGYIVYVGLTKLLFWFVHDDNLTLTTLAALFSALSTVLIFLLAFCMYDRRTALLASALWATCPLVWFHGLVGEIYAAAGFGSLATALAVFLFLRSPSRWMAACAGGVYALAAGLRPDQLLLLAPLFLFPFWRSAACRRWALFAFCSAMLVYLAWYIPTVASVGGNSNYTRLVGKQFSHAARYTNILPMLTWLIGGLALGLLPLLVIAPVLYYFSETSSRRAQTSSGAGSASVCSVPTTDLARRSRRPSLPSVLRLWTRGEHGDSLLDRIHCAALWTLRRLSAQVSWSGWNEALLLAVWPVPFLLFYTLIYIGRVAYCIACLPPILILLSRWVVVRVGGPPQLGAKRFWSLLFFSVAINVGVFFLVPRVPEPTATTKSSRLSQRLPVLMNESILACEYDQLRFDQSVKRRYFAEIRKLLLRGNSAVVLIGWECLNIRILQYYFSNVPIYAVHPQFPGVLSVQRDNSPNNPFGVIEEAEPSPTLAVAKDRVLLIHPRSQHVEVNARNGSMAEVVTEDRHDRVDICQIYVLSLTPTSSVDVTSSPQKISIVE